MLWVKKLILSKFRTRRQEWIVTGLVTLTGPFKDRQNRVAALATHDLLIKKSVIIVKYQTRERSFSRSLEVHHLSLFCSHQSLTKPLHHLFSSTRSQTTQTPCGKISIYYKSSKTTKPPNQDSHSREEPNSWNKWPKISHFWGIVPWLTTVY